MIRPKNRLASLPLLSVTHFEDLRTNESPRRKRQKERNVKGGTKRVIAVHIKPNSSLPETHRFRS